MKRLTILFVALVSLFSATVSRAGLTEAVQGGDIFYIPLASRLERYNLATGQWLTPLNFSSVVSAVYADTNALYVASARNVKRYDLEGQNETHVANFPYDVQAILG